jgi:hypothetical protein
MGMPAGWYACTVNQVGPASDGTETGLPVVYINLTDTGGAFENCWFYAADGVQRQVLEVGTAAIADGRDVTVAAVEPYPGNSPYTQVSRVYGFVPPAAPVAPADFILKSLESSQTSDFNQFLLQVGWGGEFDSQVSFDVNWQQLTELPAPLSGSQSAAPGSMSATLALNGGWTYEVSVVAVNAVGKSAPSNSITVVIPFGTPQPPETSYAELSASVAPLPPGASNVGLLIKGSHFTANETVAVAVEWTALGSTGPHVLAPVSADSSGSFEAWFTGDDPNTDGLCPVLVAPGEPQPAQYFFVCASGESSKQTVSANAGPFICGL